MNAYALIMHNVDCIRNEHSVHYRCFKSDDMHIHVHLHCSHYQRSVMTWTLTLIKAPSYNIVQMFSLA